MTGLGAISERGWANTPDRRCQFCGGLIPREGRPYDYRQRKFCNPEHYWESLKSGSWTQCAICDKKFWIAKSQRNTIKTCGKLECKRIYRKEVVNPKISKTHIQDYASGKRVPALLVIGANRAHPMESEAQMAEYLVPLGWKPEFVVHIAKPGIKDQPSYYRLDFAWPDLKLNVELDGSFHRYPSRQKRDAKRDRLLGNLGWNVKRIAVPDFLENPFETVAQVEEWRLSNSA